MRFFSWAILRRPAARAFVVGLVGLQNVAHQAETAGGENQMSFKCVPIREAVRNQSAKDKRLDEATLMIEKYRMTRRIPGLAVEIHKNGKPYYQRGFGTRDRENNFTVSQFGANNADNLKYKPDTIVNIGTCAIPIANLIYATVAKHYLDSTNDDIRRKQRVWGANIFDIFRHPEDTNKPATITNEQNQSVTLSVNDIFLKRTKCYKNFEENTPFDITPTTNDNTSYSSRATIYEKIKDAWKKPQDDDTERGKPRESLYGQMLIPAYLEMQCALRHMADERTSASNAPSSQDIERNTYRRMLMFFLRRYALDKHVAVDNAEECSEKHSNMYGSTQYGDNKSDFSNMYYENHSNMLIGISGLESNVTGLAAIGDFFLKHLNTEWKDDNAILSEGRLIEADELATLMYNRPAHSNKLKEDSSHDVNDMPYWKETSTEGFGWRTVIKRVGTIPVAHDSNTNTNTNRDSETTARADFVHSVNGKNAMIYLSRKNQDASAHTSVIRNADEIKSAGFGRTIEGCAENWNLKGKATHFSAILSGQHLKALQHWMSSELPNMINAWFGIKAKGVDGVTVAITANFDLTDDVIELCERLDNLFEDVSESDAMEDA